MRVAIIGAGLTGLTAAQLLKQQGLSPVVYDKGRGLGGRLATRRADGGLQFDHGAQYITPKSPAFAGFIDTLVAAGAAKPWPGTEGPARIVGVPGMSGIAKHLAAGVETHRSVEVPQISATKGGWLVAGAVFDRVICTAPAPQAAALLAAENDLSSALRSVEMLPNLTLMLALPADAPAPFLTRRTAGDDIAWLARDSAKRGDQGPACWVAQAGPDWSKAHLELSKEEIAQEMLPLVCRELGAAAETALYVAGHRWRYAQVATPLGQPFLSRQGVFVGGDWALSDRAEGAWQSGQAMAKAVLASG